MSVCQLTDTPAPTAPKPSTSTVPPDREFGEGECPSASLPAHQHPLPQSLPHQLSCPGGPECPDSSRPHTHLAKCGQVQAAFTSALTLLLRIATAIAQTAVASMHTSQSVTQVWATFTSAWTLLRIATASPRQQSPLCIPHKVSPRCGQHLPQSGPF